MHLLPRGRKGKRQENSPSNNYSPQKHPAQNSDDKHMVPSHITKIKEFIGTTTRRSKRQKKRVPADRFQAKRNLLGI